MTTALVIMLIVEIVVWGWLMWLAWQNARLLDDILECIRGKHL